MVSQQQQHSTKHQLLFDNYFQRNSYDIPVQVLFPNRRPVIIPKYRTGSGGTTVLRAPLVVTIISIITILSVSSTASSLIQFSRTFFLQQQQVSIQQLLLLTPTTSPTTTATATTISTSRTNQNTPNQNMSNSNRMQRTTTSNHQALPNVKSSSSSFSSSFQHSTVTSATSSSSSSSTSTTPETTTSTTARVIPQLEIPFTWQYHPPPISSVYNNNNNNSNNSNGDSNHTGSTSRNTDYYNDNPTPFGEILRGESRARILEETNDLLAFVDQSPQSKTLHALIIPKRYIPTIHELDSPDLTLLYDMEQLGQQLARKYQCYNDDTNDEKNAAFRMVFHVPPYNTVDHLHLHVLCNRDLSIFGRTVKYVNDTPWCISIQTMIQQLLQQQQ